jgi:hypothetical protein
MFSILGVLVATVGIASSKSSTVLGININLTWGIVLLIFGVLMLLGAVKGRKTPPSA